MPQTPCLREQHCAIPADCYNRISRLRVEAGGYLAFGLPGLGDNVMILRSHHWQLRNRRLDALLLSWEDFRNGVRSGLQEPVLCTMKVHHAYSRTVIHRVFDSMREFCTRSPLDPRPYAGKILSLDGTRQTPTPGGRRYRR